jgi:PPOX class probable F420-dependent enzyme
MMVRVERWIVEALDAARVARLATVGVGGAIRLVPICFAVVDEWMVSAVDHKPKRTAQLRRLADIAASGRATVLIDHYDDADWSRLWWVRIDGRAEVLADDDRPAADARAALIGKYVQYREHPPSGTVYRIAMDEVRSWRSAPT